MKKLVFILACMLSVTAMQAQSLVLNGDLPARDGSGNWYQMAYGYVDSTGPQQTQDFAGKTYYLIRCATRLVYPDWYLNYLRIPNGEAGPGTTLYYRQEDGKTYRYNKEAEKEELIMDINLDKGDEFIRPNGEKLVVEDITDESGVKVLHLKGTKADDIWRSDIGSVYYGILPSADIIPGLKLERITFDAKYAYVADVNEDHIKTATYNYKGTDQSAASIWGRSMGVLEYAFEGDVLHVTGRAIAWGEVDHIMECLIDNDNNVFLTIRSVDLHGFSNYLSEVDVKFSGFKTGIYNVYGQAMEPVTLECKAQEVDYRPFIEEGKVWKVGEINTAHSIDETYCLHYYYFDGDTVIDGRNFKKMMCHDVVNEKYPLDDGSLEATRYVVSMYEQQRKLYSIIPY